MGLSLSVKGQKIEFNLTNDEIQGYKFICKAEESKYAKKNDKFFLKVNGDMSIAAENNPDVLKLMREWEKIEFEGPDFYNSAKLTETYRGKEVRAITFPDAFIKEYEEKIDPATGDGHFNLLLAQKEDTRTDIIINPFNQEIKRSD